MTDPTFIRLSAPSVAAVQQAMLDLAGLAEISGYAQVTQANAQAGDFVIMGGVGNPTDEHVGMCEDDTCSMIISNSSTPESFTWETTPAY